MASKPPKKPRGTAKILAIAGSLAAAALVTTLTLGTNGCSKSNQPAIAAPSSPIVSIPQTAAMPAPMTGSTIAATSAPKAAKKSSRQHALSTYKNPDYGISFRYPTAYTLVKEDKANLEWAGLGPVEMNFSQPGGVTLAAVRLPSGMYPGTDFASGFFAVAVNSKLSTKECEQFAFADTRHNAASVSEDNDDVDRTAPVEPMKAKLGAAEFTEVESSGGNSAKHADAKYYHVFQNGACYEFALGLETNDGKANAKPVDSNAVFGKLNWMLSTLKITAAGIPARIDPAIAATPIAISAATKALDATAASGTPPAPATTTAAVGEGKN